MRSIGKFGENLNLLQFRPQGHPRSSILVPIESAYATSYWSLVLTLVLSCTVSEIRRLRPRPIGWILRIFLSSYSAPPSPMSPLEFCGEVNREETRFVELLCGESCMILTSTVFDWSTRVTDGQTDGRYYIQLNSTQFTIHDGSIIARAIA